MIGKSRELSLYIHIPFCKRKCNYCDFCSFTSSADGLAERYADALCADMLRYADAARGREVVTVYFGGGTPSLLEPSALERLLLCIRENFDLRRDAEITLECNPATAREGFFEKIRGIGINRLSIGLQSANDGELAALGRLHSYGEFKETYFAARRAGFDNVSVDLMYGIPDQSIESFRHSLSEIVALSPEHISSYLLKIEEGTVFAARESELALPDEDMQFEMYSTMTNFLAENGYDKYEVSNFARTGFESRHNVGYWTGREYLGFGVAAHSYFDGERFGNSRDLEAYLDGRDITEERERIDGRDAAFEFVMLGMRMGKGISVDEYGRRFGRGFFEDFPSAERFERGGLVRLCNGRIAFTDEGFFVSNTVLAQFLEDFSKAVDKNAEML